MKPMPLCGEACERSRKYLALVLQRLSSAGQNAVAEQIGTSEATVSRFVSGELERACQILAVLGLKVVPVEMKCYPKDQLDAILLLAKAGMSKVETVEQLSFED